MNISGINGAGMQPGTAGIGAADKMDPVSKDLQKQIEKLQQDLKEVSANQEMPPDAKMKKRQEIQKQISELEIQLRQHQMEVKREERQKKKEEGSFDDLMGTKPQEKAGGTQNPGMSAGSMEAMISADVSLKQAGAQGSTAKKMEGKADVLEVEIKLDGGRGGSSNVEQKEAELTKVKAAAEKATASQLKSLAQASEVMQETAKAENAGGQTDADKKKTADGTQAENRPEGWDTEDTAEEMQNYGYHPVDVRL